VWLEKKIGISERRTRDITADILIITIYGRYLREENEQLRQKLMNFEQGKQGPPSIPLLHSSFMVQPKELDKLYPDTRSRWDRKSRKPIDHPKGQTGDPCNMPQTAREVSQQKKGINRLHGGGRYKPDPKQSQVDAMGRTVAQVERDMGNVTKRYIATPPKNKRDKLHVVEKDKVPKTERATRYPYDYHGIAEGHMLHAH